MYKRKVIGVLAIVLGMALFFDHAEQGDLSQRAGEIPQSAQRRLDYFFRRLIFWDDGGYVLTGSKPCSIAVVQEPFCFNSCFFSSLSPSNLRFWLGWKTWQKYENQFSHPCFSLGEEKQGNGTSVLVLVNKQEYAKVLALHRDDFEREPRMYLPNNDFLMGILLGYGRENAWLYTARDSKVGSGVVGQPLNLKPPASLNFLSLTASASANACFKFRAPPCQFPIFESLSVYSQKTHRLASFVDSQEHERFSKYVASKGIWGFATGALFADLSQWPLPGFAVDPTTTETKLLRAKYLTCRGQLIAWFDRRSFLDATLELLTQPLPQLPFAGYDRQ